MNMIHTKGLVGEALQPTSNNDIPFIRILRPKHWSNGSTSACLRCSRMSLTGEKSGSDRRPLLIRLTAAGSAVPKIVADLYERQIAWIRQVGGIKPEDLSIIITAMKRLDRFWGDQIRYRTL
jgi:hypothetical protein